MRNKLAVLFVLVPALSPAQNAPDLRQVLDRLDRLEAQNRALLDEIRSLRGQITAAAPEQAPLPERVDVVERRIDEQAQAKVEASQRLPITLTGMALFNAFSNTSLNGQSEFPVLASTVKGDHSSGGTFRQSVIGLKFNGPEIPGGGKVSGSLFMDLFGGSAD